VTKKEKPKDEEKLRMDKAEIAPEEASPNVVADLETRLKRADAIANKYKKQLVVMQNKLEDAVNGQEKNEEIMTTNISKIETLMKDHQAAIKQSQEMVNSFEDDKAALLREKASSDAREEELNKVIRHLKDTLDRRERRRSGEHDRGRSSRYDGHRTREYDRYSPTGPRSSSVGPASPMAARRDSSQNYARLLRHKDRLLEQLQLELAEAQVKIMELENTGSSRINELERMLIDTRVQNAKLLEDKDYYQTLFEEQMLVQEQMLERRSATSNATSTISASSSVSQQLSRETPASSVYGGYESPEQVRKLEAEVNTLQDQNKALTQYVDQIVSKLMQHESFEPLFADGSVTGDNPLKLAHSAKENAPPSLLRRAGSIFGGKARPRPSLSHSHPNSQEHIRDSTASQPISPLADAPILLTATSSRPSPNPNEDQTTATRVPIRRPISTRYSSNEWQVPTIPSTNANNPGPSRNGAGIRQTSAASTASYFGNGGGVPISPTLHPNADTTSIISRATSDSGISTVEHTQFPDSTSTTTTTTTNHAPPTAPMQSHQQGLHRSNTVISSSQGPRPLRLVQAKVEADNAEERARKVANRQSWRGWFGKGPDPNAIGPGPDMRPPPPYVASVLGDSAQERRERRVSQQDVASLASVSEVAGKE